MRTTRSALFALSCLAGTLRAASTGGFLLETIGSVTSNPAEVVSGTRSVKGSYSGSNSYTPYLRSDPSRLPLQRNQTYTVTFRYKILTTPTRGFEVLFYSPIAGQQNNFLTSQTILGKAGDTGTMSLTNTLGSFDDYQVRWNVIGTGAIAVDDVQLVNNNTTQTVASEDVEVGTALLSTFFVSASKPTFLWGEPVKVSAGYYDETGKPRTFGPVTWTVIESPPAATVAPDGTVTPRALSTFTVRGAMGGATGDVKMQVIPKRIVVTPEKTPMLVGSTQSMRADVMDVNDKPIPNVNVIWRVSSEFYDSSPSATIDATGTLRGVMQSRVRILARIQYSGFLPNGEQITQGDTIVDIKAPEAYKFERIFVAKQPDSSSSTLAPRPAQLIPTEKGGFMFAASLDGLGNALLEWDNGNLIPRLTSGRVNPVNGYPLANFVAYSRTSTGEVMAQEVDSSGSALVSRGAPDLIVPIYASGAAIFGAKNAGTFDISRNSLSDSGAMLMRVGFNDAVTNLYTSGIYRGFQRGLSERVLTGRDSRIASGETPGWFDDWGIANDGTAWIESGGPGSSSVGIWRARPGQAPEKLVSSGDQIGDGRVGGTSINYSTTEPLQFVAGNGDVVNAVNTDKGQRFLLWHDGDQKPSMILSANAYGLYWYDPARGALLDTAFPGKPRGLYLWNGDGTKPLLLLNDTSLDGSPVQEILSATNTSDGTIYVMVRTANNPMVIARLSPSPQVLLRSGDSVPVSVPPVITALIPGARTGIPMVIAGGRTGSIGKLDENGVITPVVAVGTKLPDGKYFSGAGLDMVRTLPDGKIVFAHDYFASDSSLFTWNNGNIEVTVKAPLKKPDGASIGSPRSIEVNRQGDIAFHMGWNCCAIYRIRDGKITAALEGQPSIVDGAALQFPGVQGIDDSGNILFRGTKPDGSSFYLGVWDGSETHLIMTPGQKMPDGRQVTSTSTIRACSDGFIVGTLGNVARYRNGAWDYLTNPTQTLATGLAANNMSIYDANRQCEVVFNDNGGGVGAYAGSQYREIQDLQQLTADGDLLTISQMLINDDATVYALGANDRGEEVLYRGTPMP